MLNKSCVLLLSYFMVFTKLHRLSTQTRSHPAALFFAPGQSAPCT